MDCRLIGDIGGDIEALLAECLHFLDDFVAQVEQVGDDNVAPFFGNAQGSGAPNSTCASGDQGDSTLFGCCKAKIWHDEKEPF